MATAARRRRRPRRKRAYDPAAARAYGTEHRKLRAALLAAYVPGLTLCWRCGQPITGPPRMVHLGHDDSDRTVWRGLEHRTCNVSAGATNGNRKRAQTGRPPRIW